MFEVDGGDAERSAVRRESKNGEFVFDLCWHKKRDVVL